MLHETSSLFTPSSKNSNNQSNSFAPIYPSPLPSIDSITILRSKDPERPMHKVFLENNNELEKRDFQRAKYFSYESLQAATINDLYTVISDGSEDKYSCIVRGSIDAQAPPTINRKKKENGGYIAEEDHRWFELDLDQDKNGDKKGIELPFECHTEEDFQRAALWLRDRFLPSEFHDVTCVFQWSASSFVESARHAKAHLWFMFDRPVCNATLKPYLKKIGVDDSVAVSNHPLYIAAPSFPKGRDPVEKRTFLLESAGKERKKDVVIAPISLLSQPAYDFQQEEIRRAREEERAKKITGLPQKVGATRKAKHSSAVLTTACNEILRADLKHNELYKQSAWIGKVVAGDNELDYFEAETALMDVARSIYGETKRLNKELQTVKDGLRDGQRTPYDFSLSDISQCSKVIASKSPLQYTHTSKKSLQIDLLQEIEEVVEEAGTFVFRVGTGLGKSYSVTEVVKALSKAKPELRILFSVPTIELRSQRHDEMKEKHGLIAKEIKGRQGGDEKTRNCAMFEEYLQATLLGPKHGASFCVSCPFNPRNGGECSPPNKEIIKQGHIALCTHALASSIIADTTTEQLDVEKRPYDLLIWDEELKIDYKTLSFEELFGLDEIAGDGVAEIIKRLYESRENGERISFQGNELQEIFEHVTVELDKKGRGLALQKRIDGCEENPNYPHFQILKQLQEAISRKDYSGIYGYKAKLYIPMKAYFPEAKTRIVLDATVTPLIAKALYGPHQWKELTLEPNKNITHIHINAPGGVNEAKISEEGKLEFRSQKLQDLFEALKKLFPTNEHLWHMFKKWNQKEENELYYNGSQSKGSNKFENLEGSVGYDFRVPKAVKEAHEALFASLLMKEKVSFSQNELQKEVIEMLELAPIIQGPGGRTRLQNATQENPKILVTIGREQRIYGLARAENTIELWPSEVIEWGGKINGTVAPYVIRALAKKEGGVLRNELHNIEEITLSPSEINPRLKFPANPRLQSFLDTPQIFRVKDKLYKNWIEDQEINKLGVKIQVPGQPAFNFLPSSKETMEEEVFKFAKKNGWGWFEVINSEGARILFWDRLLSILPNEIENRKDVVRYLRAKGVAKRTAYSRFDNAGGIEGVREIKKLAKKMDMRTSHKVVYKTTSYKKCRVVTKLHIYTKATLKIRRTFISTLKSPSFIKKEKLLRFGKKEGERGLQNNKILTSSLLQLLIL